VCSISLSVPVGVCMSVRACVCVGVWSYCWHQTSHLQISVHRSTRQCSSPCSLKLQIITGVFDVIMCYIIPWHCRVVIEAPHPRYESRRHNTRGFVTGKYTFPFSFPLSWQRTYRLSPASAHTRRCRRWCPIRSSLLSVKSGSRPC